MQRALVLLWCMCTSYTVSGVVSEEHTQHTRGVGGAFMQTVEWEESKKRVIDTGKVEKERAGLNRAETGRERVQLPDVLVPLDLGQEEATGGGRVLGAERAQVRAGGRERGRGC